MSKEVKEVTCNKCGTVHFSVTFKDASENVKNFNHYYFALSEKEQAEMYGGLPSGMIQYEQCSVCKNSYKDFRDAKKHDAPMGVTLSPILERTHEN